MRKSGIRIAAVALLILVTSAFGKTASVEEQVHAVYDQWTHAIETANGNPQPVVALYAPKAILLATLSPLPLTDSQQMNEYFAKLTSHKDMKVQTKQIITHVFPGIAINSGVYVFSFLDKNNKPVALEARFSFVYYQSNGHWLIVNHHSSLLPSAD